MDYLPSWPLEITPLMVFGAMLIIGAIGGYVAHRLSWLPSITGFMIIGFLIGPSCLGFLSQEAVTESHILIDIALALILYRLGLSLDLSLLRRKPSLIVTSLLESAATFGAVYYVLYLFHMPHAMAALVAAITVSSSPAVLLHVAHEVGAEGEVTESTKTLVALNNLFSFIAYSAVLPLMHFETGAEWTTIVIQPLYQLVGSLALGIVIAIGLHQVTSRTSTATQYRLALVIGAITIAIGLATELKLSTLLVPMAVGCMIKNLEREVEVSTIAFGTAFELFFIILFVYAGAGLHLHELITYAPAVLAVIAARTLAKVLMVSLTTAAFREPMRAGLSRGMLLIPMAGLAIGLIQASSDMFPQYAAKVSAIVLGAVTVFETIGPPIAALAFRLCGESAATRVRDDEGEEADDLPDVAEAESH